MGRVQGLETHLEPTQIGINSHMQHGPNDDRCCLGPRLFYLYITSSIIHCAKCQFIIVYTALYELKFRLTELEQTKHNYYVVFKLVTCGFFAMV
jgi:hypothetical protein